MSSYSWICPKAIMFVGDVQLFVRKMRINYVMSKEKNITQASTWTLYPHLA